MSKPWGNIGAWAADAEQAEAEEREAAAAEAAAASTESKSFPSLKEAVSAKPKKKKMTLTEFTMGGYAASAAAPATADYSYNRLTPEEMLRLPTGPKERSAEELQQGRLGGGFSSYGRPARSDSTWGGGANRRSYGGFDDEQPRRGPPSRVSDMDQPSRADEVDNWAMTKKPFQSGPSQERQSRYGGLGSGGGGGGGGGGFSRADEVDNWTAGKKPIATRSSTFGSGFRSSGPEPDRWSRGGGFREERSKLNLDPPKADSGENEPVVVKTNKPNPFGAARPREQVLAEKGLDWKKLEMELESKKSTSRPTSAHSSRPSSAQSSRSESQVLENVVRPSRPKVNPFGDAKPREVLLEERGQDWRKIDLELERRRLERPESEEEKLLKEEINHLRKELEKESTDTAGSESQQGSGAEQSKLNDILASKERDLEMLGRELDEKLRVGQRPGSGAGRAAGFPERPPSHSGSFDESRSTEFMDRPRSRGSADVWTRPGEDRRASFQGGRERGFLGSRELNRPKSRDRW